MAPSLLVMRLSKFFKKAVSHLKAELGRGQVPAAAATSKGLPAVKCPPDPQHELGSHAQRAPEAQVIPLRGLIPDIPSQSTAGSCIHHNADLARVDTAMASVHAEEGDILDAGVESLGLPQGRLLTASGPQVLQRSPSTCWSL